MVVGCDKDVGTLTDAQGDNICLFRYYRDKVDSDDSHLVSINGEFHDSISANVGDA